MAKIPLIIDCDPGHDDAIALMRAASASDVLDLRAVTTVGGAQSVDKTFYNARRVLTVIGLDVPVARGAAQPMVRKALGGTEIVHGESGLDGPRLPEPDLTPCNLTAFELLCKVLEEAEEPVTICPTGPMTNIEAALKKAPEIKDEIGQIVLMGGALTVPGNCNACMEANISQDPEAADYLFRSGAPTTMIGLDVTLQTLLTYKETQQWRDLGTKAGKFLADMTDFYIKAYETTSPHLGGCGLHDPLAVGVAVDPTLVTTLDINMKVDVEGPTRGRTIGDETRLNDPAKTMKVAVGVDVPRFLNEFMTRISGLAAKAE